VGEFSAPVQTGPGARPASYSVDTGSFPGVKWPGRGVNRPPLIKPKLKKEQSYTSPSVCLHGRSWGDLYLYFSTAVRPGMLPQASKPPLPPLIVLSFDV
jgi:hypothetical protein